MNARRAILFVALAAVAADGCRFPRQATVQDIDWRTSPLDLDLRGMDGARYRFRCPAGKPVPELVAGSGTYTDSSSICSAAVHAGAIDARDGGIVEIRILPGRRGYAGSTRNFMRSQTFAHAWGGSFAVLSAEDAGL